MIKVEKIDIKIIRSYLKSKLKYDYVEEWDDQTCFNELIHILNFEG